MAAIEQGIISNTTNKRLHELESKQEELERQILIEKSKLAVQLPESTVRKFYTDALKAEPKLLIDYVDGKDITKQMMPTIRFKDKKTAIPTRKRRPEYFYCYTSDNRASPSSAFIFCPAITRAVFSGSSVRNTRIPFPLNIKE